MSRIWLIYFLKATGLEEAHKALHSDPPPIKQPRQIIERFLGVAEMQVFTLILFFIQGWGEIMCSVPHLR